MDTELSKEQRNFTCFVMICVDFLKLPLVDILESHIEPRNLYDKITNSPALSARNALRQDQQKICFFPPPVLPNYNKFDVTLLYTLIRNLCPSLKPTQGWGKEPYAVDISLGDDIERLRCFRNKYYAHKTSSEMPDDVFKDLWKDMKLIIKRIQVFTTQNGYKTNYVQKLKKIKKQQFGYEMMDTYKLCLEALLNSSKQEEKKDVPDILIKGSDEVTCGGTAHFELEVAQEDLLYWSVTWQKVKGGVTERIDTNNMRYCDSSDSRLVIHPVCKEDKGNYQAVLSRISNGKTIKIISNEIFLQTFGELPFLELEVLTKDTYVTINYNFGVPEGSPKVCQLHWTKNGEKLNLKSERYIGGSLNEKYLTVKMPTKDDKGNYLCTVINAVGALSREVVFDVPRATISTDSTVYFGSTTMIKSTVSSCPLPNKIEWQKSSDGQNFDFIDISKREYYGSSLNVTSPKLQIPKTTFDDQLYYRLFVRNAIGEEISDSLHLNVAGDPPSIRINHDICLKKRAVKLIAKVYLYLGELPAIQDVFWTKDGKKIDTNGSGGKYSEVTIQDPSLTIFDVNHHDAGSYQLIATNAVGSNKSEVIVLGVPEVVLETSEKRLDGTFCFTLTIKSIPDATYVQWGMRANNDNNVIKLNGDMKEFSGTSNALPHPVLVVKQNKIGNYRFQIEVKNFIGSCIKTLSDLWKQEKRYEEIRIVLLGKTGHGKSATANSILGMNVFRSLVSGHSVTSHCSHESAIRFGRKLVVVETPGIFDTSRSNEEIQKEISKCIAITSPGAHAFILVLSTCRFTGEEQQTIEHFSKYFGEDMFRFVIVLFTRKDDLDAQQSTLLDYIKTTPQKLQMLIKKCGDRVIAFNNRLKGEEQDTQSKQLLNMILENVEINGGEYYTSEMYKAAEEIMIAREQQYLSTQKENYNKFRRAIETQIARKYQIQSEEYERKLQSVQHQLEELIQKQDEKTEEDVDDGVCQIKELLASKEEIEKNQKEMPKMQEEEFSNMKKDIQDEFEMKLSTSRDEARREIENNEGTFYSAYITRLLHRFFWWAEYHQ